MKICLIYCHPKWEEDFMDYICDNCLNDGNEYYYYRDNDLPPREKFNVIVYQDVGTIHPDKLLKYLYEPKPENLKGIRWLHLWEAANIGRRNNFFER